MKQKLFKFIQFFYLYKKKHPKRAMTFLVFIVVPLITGLILGYEMSSNVAMSIPTVIVNHDNSEFSRSFVEYVSESEYFKVVEQADNDGRAEEMLFQRDAFVGVIIPKDLYSEMREGKASKILVIYDGSTMAVMSSSKSAMTEILLTLKTAYMMKTYEGKLGIVPADVRNHAMPIDVTYRLLFNPTRNFRNFILPGILAALIQVGIACMGAERAGEMRAGKVPFAAHLKTIGHWGLLGGVSIMLTLLEQYIFFDMPYKGTLTGGIILTILFSTAILTLGYIIGSIIPTRTLASQIAAVCVLPTAILGGYTWPMLAMPSFFQQLAKLIPFYYYGDAVRNLCLKPLELPHIIPDIGVMCIFIAVELMLLYLIKHSRDGLFRLIIELIEKNKPVIIVILVPIGFTILFGAAMSPIFVDEIPIAVLDMDESPASREIIEDFRACPVFNIAEMADSSEQIKEGILTGDIKGGLILPEGFGKDISEKKGTKALMLMDGTNFLIGNNLMLYSNKIFTDKSSKLQITYMESKGMTEYSIDQNINTLSLAERTLYNPQPGYFYYLYPGLLGIFVQQTYLNVVAMMLLKEKDRLKLTPMDRRSRRIRAREMVPKLFQLAGFSFICALSCILTAHWLFAYPVEGNLGFILLLQVIFLTCLTAMAFVLAAVFDDVTHCTQFVMFLAIPTMLSCGYGWPVFMMAPGFGAVMKTIWPLYYYSNPLKELLLKGSGFYAIDNYIMGGIIFAAFWLPAGMWIYRQKIRTMKQIEDMEQVELKAINRADRV